MMRFLTILTAMAVLFVSGCTHDLHFDEHAPYPSGDTIKAPLVIVVPDDGDTTHLLADLGSDMDPMKFRVHYEEAIRHEAMARFRNTFTDTAVVCEMEFALANDLPIQPPVTEKALKEWEQKVHMTSEEIEFLPDIVFENDGYLLRFNEVRFTLTKDRPLYVNDITFLNRETEEVLLEGRIRGSGSTIAQTQGVENLADRIKEITSEAASTLMLNLARDMINSIAREQGDLET